VPRNTFSEYKKIAAKHKPLSLVDERRLIARAKKGDTSARDKLICHLIGFLLFRIETTLYPCLKNEFGMDIINECILFAEKKINRYNLRFRNKKGKHVKVYLRSYLWKGITGIMITYIKQNRNLEPSLDYVMETDYDEPDYD